MTDPTAPRPGNDYVQSFARGLAVIRSFGPGAPAQTVGDVAGRTGLTRAAARRILMTLEGLGYVAAEGREFRLTPRILDLGYAYLSSLPTWELGHGVLEDLVERTGEAGSAAVLEEDDIVFVMRVAARQMMSINISVGSRLPAWCTSMGRMLMAGLGDEAVRERLRRSEIRPLTARTLTDAERIAGEVARAREQGWCLVDQELEEGLVSLSAPVFDRAGRTVAALNLSAQAARTSAQAMVRSRLPALREAAQRLSGLLQSAR